MYISLTYIFICWAYTAICDPVCANGGNCTSPGVCNCTSDWDGPSCETGDEIACMSAITYTVNNTINSYLLRRILHG